MIFYTFQLPKVSLNEWYAGTHWTKRKKMKDIYRMIIGKHNITTPCEVDYDFEFKFRPLDCSNCVAMVKMIEDCLFENDSPKIVKSIKISSRKSNKDQVTLKINYDL